jgi:hypothetical protein
MVASGTAELAENGVDPDLLLAQAGREIPRLQPIAESVFSRWLQL